MKPFDIASNETAIRVPGGWAIYSVWDQKIPLRFVKDVK